MRITIRLSDLANIDADPHRLQIRSGLNVAALDHYTQLVKDGIDLQEITVFDTGREKLIADGFHRATAYRQAGRESVPADIRQGTIADAQWYALAANLKHGVPLSRDERAEAIRAALRLHPERSDRAIAGHLGCHHTTVAKHRREMESTGYLASSTTRTGLDGKARPASRPAPAIISDDLPPSADETDPVNRKCNRCNLVRPGHVGFCPNCGSPEFELTGEPVGLDDPPPVVDDLPADETLDLPPTADETAPAVPRDREGHPLDRPELAQLFTRRHELEEMARAVARIKNRITAMREARDPLTADIRTNQYELDAGGLHRVIMAAIPHAVCPYCGGDGCETCYGRGLVNKATWLMAPEEMKRSLWPEGGR